ncbi:MAG: TolC family protein [Stagnimonas sp.]|nr:TolC family protein [Stagnimonas sp.]
MKNPTRPALFVATALLTACAGLPADGGRAEVGALTAAHGRALPSGDAEALTQRLLAEPITADAAVTLALLNSPTVRLAAARLGMAAASVYDAARLSNPGLSMARLSSNDAAAVQPQLSFGLAFQFTELLFLSQRKAAATAESDAVKLEVADAVMALAAETEAAWYRAAAARQSAALQATLARGARASATLAQRFADAGNLNARALALQQAAATEAEIAADAARAEAAQQHSTLNARMGLPVARDGWVLAEGLPAPAATEPTLAEVQVLAVDARLDIAAAQRRAQAVAQATGLARSTRLLGPLEIGVEYERETDGSRLLGPTLALELPLFNWGAGRAARAAAQLEEAEAELDMRVIDAGNAVKSTHGALLAARARVDRYREALIPAHEQVLAEMQREQNYMLIGVFELLAARRETSAVYVQYLDAVRDYWLARTALAQAVGRQLPASPEAASIRADALLPSSTPDAALPPAHSHAHGEHP